MKFKANVESLVYAMQQVTVAVSKRTTNPLLVNVLITADAKGVKLRATDQFLAAAAPVDGAEVATEGSLAVDANRLLQLVSAMSRSKAMTFTEKADTCQVTCSGSRYKLPALDAEEFPEQPKPSKAAAHWKLPGDLLGGAIRLVETGMSTEETRAHLCGLKMDLTPSQATLVSCDGSQLIRSDFKRAGAFKGKDEIGVLIPARAVGALKRLAGDVEVVEFALTQKHLFFWGGGVGFATKLLIDSEKFIPYEKVIPSYKPTTKADVSRKILSAALKRLLIMEDQAVTMLVQKGKLEVRADTDKAGAGVEKLKAETSGKPIQVTFDGKDLAAILDRFGGTRVECSFRNETDAGVFTPPGTDEPDVVAVLMPLRQA